MDTTDTDREYLAWFAGLEAETRDMIRRNVREAIAAYDPSDCWHYHGSPCPSCARHEANTHRATLIGA